MGPMTSTTAAPRRRQWDLVCLALGAITASISILFSAWFTVWFQLFGDQPDRGDYAVASGLYAGGAVWLAMASGIARLAGASRWLRWWCGVSLGLFALLWLGARTSANDADIEPASLSGDTFWSGFGGTMLYMPWNWLVLLSLVLALVQRSRGRARVANATTDGT
jgi:hypothetical protein